MCHAVIVNHNAGSPYHGPNFRSYYAAKGWVKNGIRTTILCSSFSHKLNKLPQVKGSQLEEWIDGIRYIWLKTKPFSGNLGRLLNYIEFYRILGQAENIIPEPVDFVICSSPPPFWIWPCQVFARRKKAHLIFEARDLWPDVVFETTRMAFFNPVAWCMRAAELTAYKHADSVVAVNESAIQVMEKRGLSPSKFFAIPNGASIDLEEKIESVPNATLLCNTLKQQGRFVVGYSGALSKAYGLSYLVKAAESMKNENVAFVLAGVGEFEAVLRKAANKLPNLYLVGWIPKEQLQAFLKSVDICFAGLLNIRSFSFGSDSTKLYEYMKASKPVLHAIGNKDSIIAQAKCGIRVAPENSSAIVTGIKYLKMHGASDLIEMGMLGLEFLRKNRSYDVLTKKWLELFSHMDKSEKPAAGKIQTFCRKDYVKHF